MGCKSCYDSRKTKKHIKKLARIWEEKTGEKTRLIEKKIGGKVYWDFEVII
jgi:hypothetical protein